MAKVCGTPPALRVHTPALMATAAAFLVIPVTNACLTTAELTRMSGPPEGLFHALQAPPPAASQPAAPARVAAEVAPAAESPPPEAAPEQPAHAQVAAVPAASHASAPNDPRAVSPASALRTVQVGLPRSTNEVRDYIRRSAVARGLDPDVALRVVLSEGGLNPATWVGDHGSSFGPFQLHYGGLASDGNAVAGLGEAFTKETGLRASDPSTWRQQIDWSLEHARRSGWTPWHGAAAAGIGPHQGLHAERTTVHAALRPGRVVVPNQFASNLSTQEAYAACGPVAAVAVARWLGRNPTVAEALAFAKRTGWTVQGGMNGIANEKRLLETMHVNARLEPTVNWRLVQSEAVHGNPVIVSTPNHYWVIDDYDPRSQRYHVGQSGLAYRGGAEWMSAADIQSFGGGLNGALYVEHPLASRGKVERA